MRIVSLLAVPAFLLAASLAAQTSHRPLAAVGLTYAYYPSEGSLGSGRFGVLGQVPVIARPRWTLSLEGQYQPLTEDATRFRGFSPFPPPGGFVDETHTATRSVAALGLSAAWHPTRYLGLVFAGHVQRFSRRSEVTERDSAGTLLSHSSRSVSGYGPGLQIGVRGALPSMGPFMPRLELRGVFATLESEGRQFYFYPVAALVVGIGR